MEGKRKAAVLFQNLLRQSKKRRRKEEEMCDDLINEEFTDDEDDHEGVVGIIRESQMSIANKQKKFGRTGTLIGMIWNSRHG